MKAQVKTNNWTTWINLVVLSIAVAILSACGGGGGGGGSTLGSTSGLTSGQIEGFGSIIVNGVKFEVEGAQVEFEHGQTVIISNATQTQHLQEGMQVEVEVEFNDNGRTGTATRIIVDDELEGEISGLTTAATGVVTFSVLGQTVVAIPGMTNIDDSSPLSNSLGNLANGQFVEVHGLPDGNGTIQATFIEYKAADQASFESLSNGEGEYEVTGAITALGAGSTFDIGSLTVDYSGTTPDGTLAVGTLVEVKGTLNGGTLEATRVHVEDGLGIDVAKVEIEGLVRNLDNPVSGQFSLNGQIVDYSSATFFGGVAADLRNGLKVEAEGPIEGNVLFATKIKYKDSFRYEGMASEDSATQLSLSVPAPAGGTLTVILDSSISRIEGGINYATDPVKIRARIVSGATLIATRVDSGGNNDRQIFEAPVVSFSQANDSVELLDDGSQSGVGLIEVNTATISQSPPSNFEIEGTPVPKATFYSNLSVNDRVKARYRNGEWDQIEIQLED